MTKKEPLEAIKDAPEDAILLHYLDGKIEEIEYDSKCNEIIIW